MTSKIASLFLIALLLITSCTSTSGSDTSSSETSKKDITISGNIHNLDVAKFGDKVSFGYHDYMVGDYQELKATIDTTTGDFKTSISSIAPVQIYFYHNNSLEIILSPGDSIHFKMDGSLTDKTAFINTLEISGDAVQTTKNLIAFHQDFKPDYARNELEIKKGDPESYKKYVDSLYIERNKKIQDFAANNELSSMFKNWLAVEEKYAKNVALLQYPPLYNMFTRQFLDVTPDYFNDAMKVPNFTKEDLANNTLARNYIQYYYYQLRTELQSKLSQEELKDPKKRDSVFYNTINTIAKDNTLMAQLITLTSLQGELNNNTIEGYERNLTQIENLFSGSDFAGPLNAKYTKVKNLLENPVLSEGTELLTFQSESPEGYLKEIIANANGKVIYIDNWATWCGPCKSEFKNSTPQLKEKFQKDVEFIYLCHQSEEKLWKPSISEFKVKGKHYFLSQEESNPIFKEINLQGFPTYTIINKKGDIVKSGFEYRPSNTITSEILTELIAE
ncbi:redoxin family protein [uncultured Dokdonia sp.]|uniref:TlpA family protein disulfide reductase n=1 Tax=uncultured Dokdonia sp. TaxID=575653 RepID=UPI00260CEDFC|nr:redoxin family protein [uncultured Dokdonia sp.]